MVVLRREGWNTKGGGNGHTDDIPTPVRTPRPRTSHQSKAPTNPAAPVPEAKYLVSSKGKERFGDNKGLT